MPLDLRESQHITVEATVASYGCGGHLHRDVAIAIEARVLTQKLLPFGQEWRGFAPLEREPHKRDCCEQAARAASAAPLYRNCIRRCRQNVARAGRSSEGDQAFLTNSDLSCIGPMPAILQSIL